MELKSTTELRPCIVRGEKALFHRWEERSYIVDPSPMVGGHKGGVVQGCMALIETADGRIHSCYPSQIVFCDNKLSQYCFNKLQQEVDEE